MIRRLGILVFVLLILALAACSGSPAPAEFTIEMSEFAFTPNVFEVQVGQEVTIHLKNAGALNHELMIGQNAMMMDGMPSGFEHNLFENSEPMVMGGMSEGDMESDDHGMEEMDHGFMVLMPKGAEDATINFTVTEDMAGTWELGCFTDSGVHYNQGMTGIFIVNP